MMAVTEISAAVMIGLFGGGGLLALALKRTWSQTDRADDAYLRGHEAGEDRHRRELEALRSELREQMAAQQRRHADEIAALHAHIDKVYAALGTIIPMVAPENVAAATSLIVNLGPPRYNDEPNPTGEP